MSLRPGIGAGFMPEVASVLLTHDLEQLPDVPTSLRIGSRVRPLGRYLTRTLRTHVGMAPNAPTSTLEAQQEKLRPLQEAAKTMAPKGLYSETLKSLIIESNEGSYQSTLAKSRIYKKRGTL